MKFISEIKKHKKDIFISIVILLMSYIINFFASYYVMKKADVNCVPDLILDHFGPYNLNFFYSWIAVAIFIIFITYPLICKIKDFLYICLQLSFLVIVRSFFIILTHLKTPITAVNANFPGIFDIFKFTNDQFFSGHVAFTFLGFLVFKDSKIKWFFLVGSILMAITVLAMHQHYSIDVFAAFFITYGCYKIVNKYFKKD